MTLKTIGIALIWLTFAGNSFAADTAVFRCAAGEGRIKASFLFAVALNEDGTVREDGNEYWHNIVHVPLRDRQGREALTHVFVTDAQNKTRDEQFLRYFWNLKGSTGQLLTAGMADEKDASTGDIYFYGATYSDMNQSQLLLFSADGYRRGEFRFRANGELLYRTQLICKKGIL